MTSENAGHLHHRKPGDPHDLNTLRQQAKPLQVDMSVDIGKLSAFAPQDKLDISAITGKLAPESGGLQVSADLGKLDEGLRKLREQEANARLRRLLEQAQQKMDQDKFHTAITLLDQALEIDRTSALAWLLKGQCHYALGEFDRALELLAKAQEHTQDREMVMLVLRVRAACEHEITRAIESELVELFDANELEQAGELVERELRRHPNNPALRYYQCALLFMMNRLDEARAAMDAALAVMDEVNVEVFQRLHRRILLAIYVPQREAARKCLRRRNPKGAIRQLENCPDALRGDEQFEALWSYAQERYADSARLSFVGRARTRRADAEPLDEPVLQSILLWLLSEELGAGVGAVDKDDFIGACAHFVAAEKIDSRSSVVAFLHALAEFRVVEQSFASKSPPNFDDADRRLRFAAQLAVNASHDPVVREQSKALAETISANQRELKRIRKVTECLSSFSNLMSHYERHPIRNRYELAAAKNSLRSIRNNVEATRRDHPEGSREREVLDNLKESITRVQAQLP